MTARPQLLTFSAIVSLYTDVTNCRKELVALIQALPSSSEVAQDAWPPQSQSHGPGRHWPPRRRTSCTSSCSRGTSLLRAAAAGALSAAAEEAAASLTASRPSPRPRSLPLASV